jgi:hypothetical protein
MFVIRMRVGTEVVPVPKNGMILFGCWRFHHGPPSDGKTVINRFFFNLECRETAKFRKERVQEGKRKGSSQVEVVQLSADMVGTVNASNQATVIPIPDGWNRMLQNSRKSEDNRPKDKESLLNFYKPTCAPFPTSDWYGLTLDHNFAV